MMLKNISQLQHKIGEKMFRLQCESDASLVDVKESLCHFIKYICLIEESIKAIQSQKEAEKAADPKTEDNPDREMTHD